ALPGRSSSPEYVDGLERATDCGRIEMVRALIERGLDPLNAAPVARPFRRTLASGTPPETPPAAVDTACKNGSPLLLAAILASSPGRSMRLEFDGDAPPSAAEHAIASVLREYGRRPAPRRPVNLFNAIRGRSVERVDDLLRGGP